MVEVNSDVGVVIRLWGPAPWLDRSPISQFIEKSFENSSRYSSDMIGAVDMYLDYTVPVRRLREQYEIVLVVSPLWDGKTNLVEVTDFKESTVEIRFLMSAASSSAMRDLRCFVREKMLDYLQREHPSALPKVRSDVSVSGTIGAPDRS